MKMKSLFALAMICVMVVGIVGCSSKDSKEEEKEEIKEYYKLGELIVLEDREFYVGDVGRSSGQDYVNPKDGNEFVIVSVSIKNTGNDEISYNQLYFKMQNSKGQIENVGFTMFSLDDALGSGDLAKGGEISGSIVIEQPIGDSDLTLIYETEAFGGEEVKVKLQ